MEGEFGGSLLGDLLLVLSLLGLLEPQPWELRVLSEGTHESMSVGMESMGHSLCDGKALVSDQS